MSEADLSSANLRNANLREANLLGANLANTYMRGVLYNKKTLFPEGFEFARLIADSSDDWVSPFTLYQSQYWAHALTLRFVSPAIGTLSRSIASARVDLNPHQIDAALFAVRSPFSKGVILADEVGLGKTIEAGIVIAQRWAERRRRILLIVPATLRKQWQQELQEKFGILTLILEAKNFNQAIKDEVQNPFDQTDRVIICSYNFVSAKASLVKRVNWDCIVIDEAHRLRNVYKPGNKTAKNIRDAVEAAQKLLLTATPLQNSLMELYGLVSIIDSRVFGSQTSFQSQLKCYKTEDELNEALQQRLSPLCKRTLRRQVLEYIPFTKRIPRTQEFLPTDEEYCLYAQVSAYLQRDELFALPASQRKLMTLVLRKLLASSTFAIAGTLRRLVERVEELKQGRQRKPVTEELEDDFETISELEDEWDEDEDGSAPIAADTLEEELRTLREYADLAESISHNAKGTALLTVLEQAFEQAEELGAPRKAVIFTESRRTQDYLFNLLTQHGYGGRIVLMNGSNNDPVSRQIYQRWLEQHRGTNHISGSKSADVKAAIVDQFKQPETTLLIATESAAEGINLQFCSLVVNYDLPWNPQRIEQRIGRCHRYGQQHDVVVVNFLNKRNAADERVYQLLSEKFKLFDGVFGSSDEVLGALESGVDLEKRIAQVYQDCRTAAEIQEAFDELQAELEETIQSRMAETRQKLLENFDEDVNARLSLYREEAAMALDQQHRWLISLVQQELVGAQFEPDSLRFSYVDGSQEIRHFDLDWRSAEEQKDIFFSLEHPLAQELVQTAKGRSLAPAHLVFDYNAYAGKISALEPCLGRSGWLELSKLTVESVQTEEALLYAAIADDGTTLDIELCQKLLMIPAAITDLPESELALLPTAALTDIRDRQLANFLTEVETRNGQYYDEEATKLDRWAEDLKFGLEQEIRELDRQIKEMKLAAKRTVTLAEKLEVQKQVKELEKKRNDKRRELYNAQDEVERQRDELIADIEQRLSVQHRLDTLYAIRWTLDY